MDPPFALCWQWRSPRGRGQSPMQPLITTPKVLMAPSGQPHHFLCLLKSNIEQVIVTCIHIYKYQYQAKLPVSPTHFQLKHHPLTRNIDPYASQPLDHSCLWYPSWSPVCPSQPITRPQYIEKCALHHNPDLIVRKVLFDDEYNV